MKYITWSNLVGSKQAMNDPSVGLLSLTSAVFFCFARTTHNEQQQEQRREEKETYQSSKSIKIFEMGVKHNDAFSGTAIHSKAISHVDNAYEARFTLQTDLNDGLDGVNVCRLHLKLSH